MRKLKIQDQRVLASTRPRFLAASLLIIAVSLTGCALQYRAAPFPGAGGYSEAEIRPNIMRVSYLSGQTVSPTSLEPLALYRCAELTIARGLKRFTVLDRREQSSTALRNSWAYVAFLIEMHNGAEPTTRAVGKPSYDAHELLIQLGLKIKSAA